MALIAKAQITISELEDGFYTVRLAPSAIIIPSNADGSNPVLTGAKARLFVSKEGGNTPVAINSATGVGCTVTWSGNEITITSISALEGRVVINFTTEDGYTSTTEISFLVSKQGENGEPGISVWLDNETHAIPAKYDGTIVSGGFDAAKTGVFAWKGEHLTAVAANAIPGIGKYRYNIDSVTGGTAVRINDSSLRLVTMTADTAVINIKVYVEGMDNVFTKQMTITKVREGKQGDKGDKGALPLFRGEYNKDEYGNTEVRTYYGTAQRSDIVMLGGAYYFAKDTAGVFSNISPTDPGQTKWEAFGSQLSSVATGLLLAQRAYIENLVVRNLVTSGEIGQVGVRRFELTSANAPTEPNRFAFLAPYSYYYEGLTGEVALMESKDNISQDDANGGKNIAGMRFQRPMENKNNDKVEVSGLGLYSNASGASALMSDGFSKAYGAVIGYLRRVESSLQEDVNAGIVGLQREYGSNCYAGYFQGRVRVDGTMIKRIEVENVITDNVTLMYGTEFAIINRTSGGVSLVNTLYLPSDALSGYTITIKNNQSKSFNLRPGVNNGVILQIDGTLVNPHPIPANAVRSYIHDGANWIEVNSHG